MQRKESSTGKQKCEIIGEAKVRVPTFFLLFRTRSAVLFRYKLCVYAMDEESGTIIGRVLGKNIQKGGTYWVSNDKGSMPSPHLRADIEKEYRELLKQKRTLIRELERFKL